MAAAKKASKAAKASEPSVDESSRVESGTDDQGSATSAGTRPPLAVNINIDGVWYGPAHGNADQYPDHGHDGRPQLFGIPEQLTED